MKLRRIWLAGLATAAASAALFANDAPSAGGSLAIISQAEAVIGRPLTPLSYAGVARRTTARAVVATTPVYVAPAPVVVVAPRPGCYQAVNAYGQLYWRCP